MYGYRQSTGGTTVASIARGDTKHTSFHIEPDLVVCARGTGTAERLLADHTCWLTAAVEIARDGRTRSAASLMTVRSVANIEAPIHRCWSHL